jgi:phosphotransferase system  glucose/maltose/N-acetylglucosamine-specific IIC component
MLRDLQKWQRLFHAINNGLAGGYKIIFVVRHNNIISGGFFRFVDFFRFGSQRTF